MLSRVKVNKETRMFFLNFDQTCHIVYCPHSRLAARQPDDVISVLVGPLKRRLAGLICMFTQPVVQPAVFIQMRLYRLLYKRLQRVNTVSNCLRFCVFKRSKRDFLRVLSCCTRFSRHRTISNPIHLVYKYKIYTVNHYMKV